MRIPIRMECNDYGSLQYVYICDECNKETRTARPITQKVILCRECKEKRNKEMQLKAKEKKEAEMRKYHIKHLKEFEHEIIEIITDSPSKADVITDRKNLAKLVKEYFADMTK